MNRHKQAPKTVDRSARGSDQISPAQRTKVMADADVICGFGTVSWVVHVKVLSMISKNQLDPIESVSKPPDCAPAHSLNGARHGRRVYWVHGASNSSNSVKVL